MTQSENLVQYGTSFQSKIITSLLLDNKFTKQIVDILEVSYFDTDSTKYLIKNIKEYFEKYKTPPTMESIKVIIDEVDNPTLKTTIVDSLRNAWSYRESTDLEFVKEKTLEFCKNQVVKGAIMDSVELLESQRYDEIKGLIDKAMTAGMERDIGHEYITGFDERMNQQARECLPTGWDSVNDLMDGGLAGGELGVVVAPAGIGKSWVLSSMGAYALSQGLNVVHYTFELTETAVGLRYDSNLCNIPSNEVQDNKDRVLSKYKDQDLGRLIIKEYPTGTATVQTIRNHIEKLKLKEFMPSLIVIDYADIMRSSRQYDSLRHELKLIYEELRNLAMKRPKQLKRKRQKNVSTNEMRAPGGYDKILVAMERLGAPGKQDEHIKAYDVSGGEDNKRRLTGAHETAPIDVFSWGVANRGCSVRIPRMTEKEKCGYFEDRRPSSDMCPYRVTGVLMRTCVLPDCN